MNLDMSSFGRAISSARKQKGLSQKELAAKIKKEEGEGSITPQYLNDIEHDRRSPTSDHFVREFSQVLGLKPTVLYGLIGMLPEKDRNLVKKATPEQVGEAFHAFRRKISGLNEIHPRYRARLYGTSSL